MAKDQVETTVEADPDKVWSVLGDFGGIDAFFPGIDSCRVEGDVRILDMGGNTVKERLIAQDDEARTCTYSVIEMPGLDHRATIKVEPAASGGSRVIWEYDVQPDSMGAVFRDTYAKALEAVKSHLS